MKTTLALTVLVIALGCSRPEEAAKPPATTPGALVIVYHADSADTFVSHRTDSTVVLDWLGEVAITHDIPFEAKSFPYGTLVERIGPRRNGNGGYWLYKVNGQMVPKSADAHRVAWTDTVTFFFDER